MNRTTVLVKSFRTDVIEPGGPMRELSTLMVKGMGRDRKGLYREGLSTSMGFSSLDCFEDEGVEVEVIVRKFKVAE
jgi:hypothetical protein